MIERRLSVFGIAAFAICLLTSAAPTPVHAQNYAVPCPSGYSVIRGSQTAGPMGLIAYLCSNSAGAVVFVGQCANPTSMPTPSDCGGSSGDCPGMSVDTEIFFNMMGECAGDSNLAWNYSSVQNEDLFIGGNATVIGNPDEASNANSTIFAETFGTAVGSLYDESVVGFTDISISNGQSDPFPFYVGGYFTGSATGDMSGTGTLNEIIGTIGEAEVGGDSNTSPFGATALGVGVEGQLNVGPSGNVAEADLLLALSPDIDSGAIDPIIGTIYGLRVQDMGTLPTDVLGVEVDAQSEVGATAIAVATGGGIANLQDVDALSETTGDYTKNGAGILVSALPAAGAGNAGQWRTVTNSTAIATEGQTCDGGGSVTAAALSNGTVWKCF